MDSGKTECPAHLISKGIIIILSYPSWSTAGVEALAIVDETEVFALMTSEITINM